jgi:hypothetical protein
MTKTLLAGAALAALFAINAPVAQAYVGSQWELHGTSMRGSPWEIGVYPNRSSCEAWACFYRWWRVQDGSGDDFATAIERMGFRGSPRIYCRPYRG